MPDIYHELFIGASPGKIYDALTSQEGLWAWWTPGTKVIPGANNMIRFAFGAGYFKEMKITDLKPSERVNWICVTGAEEWIGTTISFELVACDKASLLNAHPELEDQLQQHQDGNNGTLLVFHHDEWEAYTTMFAECNYTWGRFLRSLKLWCETGKGRPSPNQHRVQP